MTPPTPTPPMKLTHDQKRALHIAAEGGGGVIIHIGNGYWVSSAASQLEKAALVRGDRTIPWPAHCGTRTVRSLERAGMLRRSEFPAEHHGQRHRPMHITQDGWSEVRRHAP